MKNYYEILEVNEKASVETIKKVFKMQIKENHPDLHKDTEKEKYETKVKELNEAYETLVDQNKRFEYDKKLDMEKNEEIQNTINNLKDELQKKEKIIQDLVNNPSLYNFNYNEPNILYDLDPPKNELNNNNKIKFRENLLNQDYTSSSLDNTSNSIDNTPSYYTKILLNVFIRILALIVIIIVSLIVISRMTNINIFNILYNAFFK